MFTPVFPQFSLVCLFLIIISFLSVCCLSFLLVLQGRMWPHRVNHSDTSLMAQTVARCARHMLLEHLAEAWACLPMPGSGYMAHNVLQNRGLHPNDLGAIPMTWGCLPAGRDAREHMYVCAGSPSNIITSQSFFFFL